MIIHALKENNPVTIDIFPYGMHVYQGKMDYNLVYSGKVDRNLILEKELIEKAEEIYNSDDNIRNILSKFGGERPEAYRFYYAAIKKFNNTIFYPYKQIFTLYPEDFTFKRIDILT